MTAAALARWIARQAEREKRQRECANTQYNQTWHGKRLQADRMTRHVGIMGQRLPMIYPTHRPFVATSFGAAEERMPTLRLAAPTRYSFSAKIEGARQNLSAS